MIVRAAALILTLAVSAPASAAVWRDLDAGETSSSRTWSGGNGTFQITGSLAGGPTVKLQWNIGGSWEDASALTGRGGEADCEHDTAEQYCHFFAPGSAKLRAVVTGGKGNDIVTAWLSGRDEASVPAEADRLTAGTSSLVLDTDTLELTDDSAPALELTGGDATVGSTAGSLHFYTLATNRYINFAQGPSAATNGSAVVVIIREGRLGIGNGFETPDDKLHLQLASGEGFAVETSAGICRYLGLLATAPSTCNVCDEYDDTDGPRCRCTSTDTFTVAYGSGSCT